MRILVPVCAGLVLASGIAATIFWREWRAERQVSEDLRMRLAEARTALAARSAAQPGAAAVAQPSADMNTLGTAAAASPAKASREAASAIVADYARKAKTLLDDPEYRKARLAQARIGLQQRYASLAVELGLSDREADALFDMLAGQQIRLEEESAARLASGATPDEATIAQVTREMTRIQQEQKDALVALLGAERYEQFQEYGQTQPARTRVNNLSTLLARSGRPLTSAQTRSLTAVIVAEQKRMESESKALRDAGQTSEQSQAERAAEVNRRILEGAAAFLDSQQLELVRGRFEQRGEIGRASDRVRQRGREVLQESPD